jgi:biofilm PGA synthesis N-glycosyltransferase PgaC
VIGIILVWLALIVLTYCYVIYPLVMTFRARGRVEKLDSEFRPSISIILAVYNEELVLRACLDSLLGLDYHEQLTEIIVGSDGSSDATNSILLEYEARCPRLKAFCFLSRRGKIPVMNELVPKAKGEILLFTDADVTFAPELAKMHVRHYANQNVGGVAGSLALAGKTDQGPLGSEQDYMSLEVRLRKHESEVHSTVGIFGGNYSLRRSMWSPLPNGPICDELYSALRIIRVNERMVFEGNAIATELFGRSMKDEYLRKRRFASRGFHTLFAFPDLLFNGLPAVMLWSHKILRWLTPFFLGVLVLGTIIGLYETPSIVFQLLAGAEGIAVLLIALGWIFDLVGVSVPLLRQAYWFFAMNVAFAMGTLRFLLRTEQTFWSQPTRAGVPDTVLHSREEVAKL